jgi:3-(3-hydroxy-phenyl)propionate hydroxylase
VPGLDKLVKDSETPPLHRSTLVERPFLGRTLAGRLCPNVLLDGDCRFDDVAGGRFALVTSIEPSTPQRAEVERRRAVLVAAGPGSELHRWLRKGHARAAIVRPDGTVLRAGRQLSALCRALPRFDTALPLTATGGAARPDMESASVSASAHGWPPGA